MCIVARRRLNQWQLLLPILHIPLLPEDGTKLICRYVSCVCKKILYVYTPALAPNSVTYLVHLSIYSN